MIIGGTSAGGKTSSLRTGYSESFFPCRAYLKNSAVEAAFNQSYNQPIIYTASARIRNISDTAWVNLGTCSYFQITRGSEGNVDSANLTIAKGEAWSAFLDGGDYEGLLLPSNRTLQLIVGIIIAGSEKRFFVFSGRINQYTENIGGNSSSINIGVTDTRAQMFKVSAIITGYEQTTYRNLLRQLKAFSDSNVGSAEAIKFNALFADSVIDSSVVGSGKVLDAISSIMPSGQNTLFTGSGIAFYGTVSGDENDYSFEYSDKNIISLTRISDDGEQYNTVRIFYTDSGTKYTKDISDAGSVAINGNIYYLGWIGGIGYTEAAATRIANELLSVSVRGKIRMEILLNPFLEPGSVIKISSQKYSIPAYYAKIISISHQYSVGRAATYINELRYIEI